VARPPAATRLDDAVAAAMAPGSLRDNAGQEEIVTGSPWWWVDERVEKGVGTMTLVGGERPPVAVDG
jgi:hypothetical protein